MSFGSRSPMYVGSAVNMAPEIDPIFRNDEVFLRDPDLAEVVGDVVDVHTSGA